MRETHSDIIVAAAAIYNAEGEILLTRRPEGVHQGGLWEFPGGKVEPGESLSGALARELAEELGIQVDDHRPLIKLRHCYQDRCVVLDVHVITEFRRRPRGLEGQPLAWVPVDALERYPMPAADRPIVNALRLPDTYVITPEAPKGAEELLSGLSHSLRQGARLIQLRLGGSRLPIKEIAAEVGARCREAGADLLINSDIALAEQLRCGVHLKSSQLFELSARPLARDLWVAASCHSRKELELACELEVDFAVLSPVKPTLSHPEAVEIGWSGFRECIDGLPIPVYGLGGLAAGDIAESWAYGAQGVAGIRAFWSKP